ncbi:MAG: hypothetical protein A2131_02075 [Candidatus Sungbacteria bacterium GWC2_49_10]|uniref:Uncharacterized protein n=2 Tax=Parcubacteria group TaxID=1794811 RepID=A0A0G1WQH2_9BACT|nr:MAG: hypothetical protein UY60_C0001G0026 [Parcubacteria group bacterium GW2011_GWB1_50_9]KKW21046.1 MAG: hypothetical protein UY61_C0016G0002 [Candidatus Adlerbacteria bacterium GW2011_GWC1_50_9]OGZ93300.1 MAG: hypothetical protein A2131_02075 [Candidatus Sungbacteria bacterium GWC2_49_10]
MKKHFFVKAIPILLLLVMLGIVSAFPAHAQSNGDLLKGISIPALLVMNGILVILRGITSLLLMVASALLNMGFAINLGAIPSEIPVVPIGWAALRDLTNGVFLLIILWISLTIIFNIEQWGGKRLLVRVVMVALLINFSLLMVTMVFGIANQLGAIFAKNMPAEPGTFIAQSIAIEKIGSVPSPSQAAAIKAEDARRALETQRAGERTITQGGPAVIKDAVLASLGVPKAEAQIGFYAGCAAGALIGGGIAYFSAGILSIVGVKIIAGACGGAALLGAISDYYYGWGQTLFDAQANMALRTLTQIILLLITALTMFWGAITLFIRYAAVIIVSVLAPFAFLAATVPGMKKYFDMWLSATLRWAFFLPLFYFLMYLGFFTMSTISLTTPAGAGIEHANRILITLIAAIFMWAAFSIARKTGGAIGEAGVNAITKLGLFAAGGAAGLAMRGAGAAIATHPETAQDWALRARRIPIVGRRIQRAMEVPIDRDQKEIEKRKDELKRASPTQLSQVYTNASSDRFDKTAAAVLLAEKEKLSEIRGHEETAYRMANRVGMGDSFLKYDPSLAVLNRGALSELEAIEKAVAKIDKTKISDESHNLAMNPHAGALIESILKTSSPKELSKIAENNQRLMQNMMTHLDRLSAAEVQDLKNRLGTTKTNQLTLYFDGTIANGIGQQLGWNTPRHW